MKNYMKSKLFCLTCLCAAMAPVHAQVPVGTWLKTETVKSVLTNGWQISKNTDKDPANNNKWNTNNGGDGFGPGGLFGGIQETLLDTQYGPPSRYPVQHGSQASTIAANTTDGPLTQALTLKYNITESVTDTSSVTDSVKTGVEISFKVSAKAFGIGAEEGFKLSEDFTRTNAKSNATTNTRSQELTNQTTVIVPPKRTYSVSVSCLEERIDLPYRSNIKLTGTSQTWFPDRVDGHYNWKNSVGGVASYSNNRPSSWQVVGNDVVVVGAQGILTAQIATNCSVITSDITGVASSTTLRSLKGSTAHHSVPQGGVLISVTPIIR